MFPPVEGARVDVQTMLEFLEKRFDEKHISVARRLGDPEPHSQGWFRLRWLPLQEGCAGTASASDLSRWERAWHGCKLESLYSILAHGRLCESTTTSPGDRTIMDVPGVYLHKDATQHKAEHYLRFVPIFNDGIFWAAKFEVLANREDRMKVRRRTDQWVQPARSVQIVALWLCGRTSEEMRGGDPIAKSWNPKHEANPFSKEWLTRVDEIRISIAAASSSQSTPQPLIASSSIYPGDCHSSENSTFRTADWGDAAEIVLAEHSWEELTLPPSAQILAAYYGDADARHGKDVTHLVQNLRSQKKPIYASNKLFGDPLRTVQKFLHIKYVSNA